VEGDREKARNPHRLVRSAGRTWYSHAHWWEGGATVLEVADEENFIANIARKKRDGRPPPRGGWVVFALPLLQGGSDRKTGLYGRAGG